MIIVVLLLFVFVCLLIVVAVVIVFCLFVYLLQVHVNCAQLKSGHYFDGVLIKVWLLWTLNYGLFI